MLLLDNVLAPESFTSDPLRDSHSQIATNFSQTFFTKNFEQSQGATVRVNSTSSSTSSRRDVLSGFSRTQYGAFITSRFTHISIVTPFSLTHATFGGTGSPTTSSYTNATGSLALFNALVNGLNNIYTFIYSSTTRAQSLQRFTTTFSAQTASFFSSSFSDASTNPKFQLTFISQRAVLTTTTPTTTQYSFGSLLGYGAGVIPRHSLKSFQGIQYLSRVNANFTGSVQDTITLASTFPLTPIFDSWDPWFRAGDYPVIKTRAKTSPYDLGANYTLSEGETFSIYPFDNITAAETVTFLRTSLTYSTGSTATGSRVYPSSGGVETGTTNTAIALYNQTYLDGTVIPNGGFHPLNSGSIDIENPSGTTTSKGLVAIREFTTGGNSTSRTFGEFLSRVEYDIDLVEGRLPIQVRGFVVRNLMTNGYVVPTFSKFFVGTGATKVQYGSTLVTEVYASSLNSAFSQIAGFITFQQSVGGTIFSLKSGLTTEVRQCFFASNSPTFYTETFSQETGIPTDSTDITTGRITKTYRTWNSTRSNNITLTNPRVITGSFTLSLSTMDTSNLSSATRLTFTPNEARSIISSPVLNANLHNIFQFGSAINARTYTGESGNDPNSLFTYRKFRNIGSATSSAYYGYARGYLEYDTATSLKPLDYLSPVSGDTGWRLVGKSNVYAPFGVAG